MIKWSFYSTEFSVHLLFLPFIRSNRSHIWKIKDNTILLYQFCTTIFQIFTILPHLKAQLHLSCCSLLSRKLSLYFACKKISEKTLLSSLKETGTPSNWRHFMRLYNMSRNVSSFVVKSMDNIEFARNWKKKTFCLEIL